MRVYRRERPKVNRYFLMYIFYASTYGAIMLITNTFLVTFFKLVLRNET